MQASGFLFIQPGSARHFSLEIDRPGFALIIRFHYQPSTSSTSIGLMTPKDRLSSAAVAASS
jgi:hypothetical protein